MCWWDVKPYSINLRLLEDKVLSSSSHVLYYKVESQLYTNTEKIVTQIKGVKHTVIRLHDT